MNEREEKNTGEIEDKHADFPLSRSSPVRLSYTSSLQLFDSPLQVFNKSPAADVLFVSSSFSTVSFCSSNWIFSFRESHFAHCQTLRREYDIGLTNQNILFLSYTVIALGTWQTGAMSFIWGLLLELLRKWGFHASGVSILLYKYLGILVAVFLSCSESFGRILLKNKISWGESKRQSPDDILVSPGSSHTWYHFT